MCTTAGVGGRGTTTRLQTQTLCIASSIGKLLTARDFREVYEALYCARHKWRKIGISLQIERSDLDNTESLYQHRSEGNDRCLEEVVSMFLKRPRLKPTWQVVIDLLKSKVVDKEEDGD